MSRKPLHTYNIVTMSEEGITTAQLLRWFPQANFVASRNAWRIEGTYFVERQFSLTNDEVSA